MRLLRQELALLDAEDLGARAGAELGRRLLCSAAARLNRLRPGFVVFAADLELMDLERNLAQLGISAAGGR